MWFRFLKVHVQNKKSKSAIVIQRLVRRYFWIEFLKKFLLKHALETQKLEATIQIQSFRRIILAKRLLSIKRKHYSSASIIQGLVRRYFWFVFFKILAQPRA